MLEPPKKGHSLMKRNLLKINPNTKRGKHIIDLYKRSTAYSLRDVYKSWSNKKENAFKDCIATMQEFGGHDLRITGAGSDTFSVAFEYTDISNGKHIVYITHVREYDLFLGYSNE